MQPYLYNCCRIRKYGKNPRPLYGYCYVSLMLCTISGDAPWGNLSPLAYKWFNSPEVFVICLKILIRAKAAYLLLWKSAFAAKLLLFATGFSFLSILSH